MNMPINMVGLCAHTRMVLFCAIVSLVIVPLGAPFVEDAAAATMADIVLYMNSNKELPEYCQCRWAEIHFRPEFRNKHSPRQIDWPAQFAKLRAKWVRLIGKNNWAHFHHYCTGIRYLNKYFRMTKYKSKTAEMRRKVALEMALKNFEYMRRRAKSSFPLWPQLFMYESQIYMQLGQPGMAQRAMQQAVEYQKRPKSRR